MYLCLNSNGDGSMWLDRVMKTKLKEKMCTPVNNRDTMISKHNSTGNREK